MVPFIEPCDDEQNPYYFGLMYRLGVNFYAWLTDGFENKILVPYVSIGAAAIPREANQLTGNKVVESLNLPKRPQVDKADVNENEP